MGSGKLKSSKKHKMADVQSNVADAVTSPEPALKKRKVEASPEAVVQSTSTPVKAISDGGDAAEAAMTKADKGKAKKRRKEEQRALENPPTFAFDTRGFKGGRMIQIKDVRDFVLHLLADEKAQQWLYVSNKRNVRRVVTVMIPGITPTTLGIPQPLYANTLPFPLTVPPASDGVTPAVSLLPTFQTLFSHACPTKAPGEKNRMHSPYQSFLNCPLTGGEKDRREKARKEQGQLSRSSDPSVYLLTPEQMAEQGYPEPTQSTRPSTSSADSFANWLRPDGWIEAPYKAPSTGPRKVLGIDCEMCLTADGSELTRVSVVDAKGKRVYDSLVKPTKPILDYLTKYSGLNEEKLRNVKTTLADVQKDLTSLFDHQTILIGHSLECDLRVLKLVHPLVIDTSVLYQHPRGPPFKASLKWLAQKWLKREIQTAVAGDSSIGGHDSEEDARTCIDLLQLKMQKGPGFGEFQNDQETVFERIARGPFSKTSAVVDHGTPGQWYGAKAKTAIACTRDEEVLNGMVSSLTDHDFVFGRFMELSHALNWSQPSNSVLDKSSATLPGGSGADTPTAPELSAEVSLSATASTTPVDILAVHDALNARLAALHAALPPLTALIIFTGHGDPQEMARLSAKKARCDRLWKTTKQSELKKEDRWMESDDRKLIEEVEKCRAGLSFYAVK